ncbi:MAG: uracil-DNA glycosylase [Fimbriimonadaceae bacterium]|nr:uracil-DNA glycosylase [Fimbriimonadaceae bacterium]
MSSPTDTELTAAITPVAGISQPLPLERWPQDLLQLRQRALCCQTCAIAERRNNVVFGEGNPASPLVLVGEGPGETEDHTGRPFVGRAGQMLDRALRDNGLSREIVYICNVVKCRACDWREGKAFNRPPTDEEVLACSQWLKPQLEIIAPKVVLCIGAPSAKLIIKKDFKITAERGKYFPCAYARTAIAALHPAYILRQSSSTHDGGYSLLVADIARAWAAAQKLLVEGQEAEPAKESSTDEQVSEQESLF